MQFFVRKGPIFSNYLIIECPEAFTALTLRGALDKGFM